MAILSEESVMVKGVVKLLCALQLSQEKGREVAKENRDDAVSIQGVRLEILCFRQMRNDWVKLATLIQ